MPKGKVNKRYTPEFKIKVVETMKKEKLSYCEAARQFDISDHKRVAAWERIYLEEGAERLQIERRGRKSTGRQPKLEKKVEEDLIAEVQRLRAENACILKKIECLGCREGTAREKAQVIWELRHEHKIGLLIDIAGISRSTYYYYSKQFENMKSNAQLDFTISDEDMKVLKKIEHIKDYGEYVLFPVFGGKLKGYSGKPGSEEV